MCTIFPLLDETLALSVLFYVSSGNPKNLLEVALNNESDFKELLYRESTDLSFWRSKVTTESEYHIPLIARPTRRSFREQYYKIQELKDFPQHIIPSLGLEREQLSLLVFDLGDQTLNYIETTLIVPQKDWNSALYVYIFAWGPLTLIEALPKVDVFHIYANYHTIECLPQDPEIYRYYKLPSKENLPWILTNLKEDRKDSYDYLGGLFNLISLPWSLREIDSLNLILWASNTKDYLLLMKKLIEQSHDVELSKRLIKDYEESLLAKKDGAETFRDFIISVLNRLAACSLEGRLKWESDLIRHKKLFKSLFLSYRHLLEPQSLTIELPYTSRVLNFLLKQSASDLVAMKY